MGGGHDGLEVIVELGWHRTLQSRIGYEDYNNRIPVGVNRKSDSFCKILTFPNKFNDKKFTSDLDNILEYYNTLGYRDATILKDTVYHTKKDD